MNQSVSTSIINLEMMWSGVAAALRNESKCHMLANRPHHIFCRSSWIRQNSSRDNFFCKVGCHHTTCVTFRANLFSKGFRKYAMTRDNVHSCIEFHVRHPSWMHLGFVEDWWGCSSLWPLKDTELAENVIWMTYDVWESRKCGPVTERVSPRDCFGWNHLDKK